MDQRLSVGARYLYKECGFLLTLTAFMEALRVAYAALQVLPHSQAAGASTFTPHLLAAGNLCDGHNRFGLEGLLRLRDQRRMVQYNNKKDHHRKSSLR